MTWLDFVFIIVFIVFVAVGAKIGSVWTGACLIAGFFGAFLVDYYTLPLSGMMGSMPAAEKIAGVVLFLSGALIVLLPGWLLSKISSGLILGVVDSFFGLVTGALTCLLAFTLAVLFVIPRVPALEKSKAWKKSMLVKPFNEAIEDVFNDRRFRRDSALTDLKDDLFKDFSPAVKSAEKSIKTASENLVEKIKKK